MLYALALLIGVISGLRAMTAPAAVSWATHFGWLNPTDPWLAFLAYPWTPWILTVFALTELITDQLPGTPSRKTPAQFLTRLISGALCGAAIGTKVDAMIPGAVLGAIGAVIGTLGGSYWRARLAASFGRDRPAALIEDAVAILGAALIVLALR